MFSDEILEKIFAHEFIMTFPIGIQSKIIHVFEEILSDRLEENPYEPIQSLFATDDE